MIACPQAEQSRKRIGEAPLSVRVEDLRIPTGMIRDRSHPQVAINGLPIGGLLRTPGLTGLRAVEVRKPWFVCHALDQRLKEVRCH